MDEGLEQSWWANMPHELLREVLLRIESSEAKWPRRRSVVACAGVCRTWRLIIKEIVKPPQLSSNITFPISLKQPGPREHLLQCFIRRDNGTQTYYLFLSLSSALADDGKFLLAARKFRRPTCTDYIISLDADYMSRESNAYIGKLRSNFLGTKFTVYDVQLPHSRANMAKSCSTKLVNPKQVSPKNNKRDDVLVLRNKAARWHEQMQCWCLNFHGRVTVASVKNFQLAALPVNGHAEPQEDDVILQFGKVGKDLFTMDYRYPISAFQAFAICLSSFATTVACE
ncbi:hypothetical protein LR48_Vigan01g311100 [Vigna angularis]|uniref:Tubby-like F-box protein n=1 Tax=Phaseolus angularis TaxID=3914 RepID=A0A0L9TSP5_PHAAN|nr:hypothetical protein LR48_Vigan01g311100 [Vigna angularis]